ncbi:hypothetical protein T484DRAFT_1799826 [Baffinella frigidus]|nr:hypothetical protein T484DRAFT_1799826 [Cryptophyta sp. CCMP2293]
MVLPFQTSLRELKIDDNRIATLPMDMHTLDMLESFSMKGNPLLMSEVSL